MPIEPTIKRMHWRTASIALVASAIVLAGAGVGHRLLAARIDAYLSEYLRPRQPLATLPLEIASCQGTDVPLDARVKEIANEDDFVNREYWDAASGRTFGVYIGYIGRPRSRLGHRPDVCYATHGYQETAREKLELQVPGHGAVPAVFYEYAPPTPGRPNQVVLATFVINGRWVNDTASADAYNARGVNLFSRQLAYVGRLQVSLVASGDRAADIEALSRFAAELSARLQDLLPQ